MILQTCARRLLVPMIAILPIGCVDRGHTADHHKADPLSPIMLAGDWVPEDTHGIDFENLPRVPAEHVIISNVGETELSERHIHNDRIVTGEQGENQHNYLLHHDGRFWAMWSDGPAIEARVGTIVKYATSLDGVNWTPPESITPYPPGSGPESPFYNTRSENGFRYMSRGFWVRNGELLALVSLDEAAGFFGQSLQLIGFRWDAETASWHEYGRVFDNTINNFPPQRLPTGEWMMSRRDFDRNVYMIIGGVDALDAWESIPVIGYLSEDLRAEEPHWWTLPDGNLVALFRDNARSGFIYRAISADNGRTWTTPIRTNFPDARSKFYGMRLKDGRYALVSNPNPDGRRDPLTLAISQDGIVFDKMFYVVGGRWIDYPHLLEHEGYLYIAHSGGKQSVEIQRISIADLDRVTMHP